MQVFQYYCKTLLEDIMGDYFQKSLELHAKLKGKIEVALKTPVETADDLSTVYTPGVARPCEEIHKHPERVFDLTMRGNSVAIATDGTAVLGLGDIGPEAALPVMEGKALLFKKFANIDAWPICLATKDTEEIIHCLRCLAPTFGGINLEDIAAPRCFEIERRLQDLGIPVFHDDQHGTAIVVLAGLINACRYLKRSIEELSVVIVGSGAAGTAIAKLLAGQEHGFNSPRVKEIVVCDSKGAISPSRMDLGADKRALLEYTNPHGKSGAFTDVLKGADVFVGVSKAGLLHKEHVALMAKNAMIFALANPVPEIMPDLAYQAGAGVVATGRSDFPNQVNNALAFPGVFRGALDARAARITPAMKMAAALALSQMVLEPTRENLLPSVLNPKVASTVARAVMEAAKRLH